MPRIKLPESNTTAPVTALMMRPELAKAVAIYSDAVWSCDLDMRIHELVRMRVAQINNCQLCLSWRTPAAVAAGVTEELITKVDKAANDDDFTAKEKIAIEYAGRFCTDSANIEDSLIERLSQHFDPGEIVELTLVIAKYLAFGRFNQVLGLDEVCTIQPSEEDRLAFVELMTGQVRTPVLS